MLQTPEVWLYRGAWQERARTHPGNDGDIGQQAQSGPEQQQRQQVDQHGRTQQPVFGDTDHHLIAHLQLQIAQCTHMPMGSAHTNLVHQPLTATGVGRTAAAG